MGGVGGSAGDGTSGRGCGFGEWGTDTRESCYDCLF